MAGIGQYTKQPKGSRGYKMTPPIIQGTTAHLQALQAHSDSPLKWAWLAKIGQAVAKAGAAAGKAVAKGAKAVAKGVGKGVKAIGKTVSKGVKGIGKGFKQAGQWLFGGQGKGVFGGAFKGGGGKIAKGSKVGKGVSKGVGKGVGKGVDKSFKIGGTSSKFGGKDPLGTGNISKNLSGGDYTQSTKLSATSQATPPPSDQKPSKMDKIKKYAELASMAGSMGGGQQSPQQEDDIAGAFAGIDYKSDAKYASYQPTPFTFQARMGRTWTSADEQFASIKAKRKQQLKAMGGPGKGMSILGPTAMTGISAGIGQAMSGTGTAKGQPMSYPTGAY